MLGRAQWQTILFIGALEGSAVLGVFAWGVQNGTLQAARSLAFSTLVFAELFRAFAARSATRIFWSVGAFTNLRLLGVVLASALVQVAIHGWSRSQSFFGIGSLSPEEWTVAVAIGLAPVSVIELLKLSRRAS